MLSSCTTICSKSGVGDSVFILAVSVSIFLFQLLLIDDATASFSQSFTPRRSKN